MLGNMSGAPTQENQGIRYYIQGTDVKNSQPTIQIDHYFSIQVSANMSSFLRKTSQEESALQMDGLPFRAGQADGEMGDTLYAFPIKETEP